MITFETKYLRYSIDEAANNVEFTDKSTGVVTVFNITGIYTI